VCLYIALGRSALSVTRSESGETAAGGPSDEDSYSLPTSPMSSQLAESLATHPPLQNAEGAIQSAASDMSAIWLAPHAFPFDSRHATLSPLPSHFDPFSNSAILPSSGSESAAASIRVMHESSGGDWYQMSVELPNTNNLPGGSRSGRSADITQYLHHGMPQGMQQGAATQSLHQSHVTPDIHLSAREIQPRQSFEQHNVHSGMRRSWLDTQHGMRHITHQATHVAGVEHDVVHSGWFNTQQGMHQATHEPMMPPPFMGSHQVRQMSPDHQMPMTDIHESATTRPAMGAYASHHMNQMGAPSTITYRAANRQQGDGADHGANAVRAPQIPTTSGMSSIFLPVTTYNIDRYTNANTSYAISTAVNTNGMTNSMHMQHDYGSQPFSTLQEASIGGPYLPAFAHGRGDEGNGDGGRGGRHWQHDNTYGAPNMQGWNFQAGGFDPSHGTTK